MSETPKTETPAVNESAVDQAAKTDGAPPLAENLPAEPGTIPEPVQRGERRGMFGAHDSGDTSGYGGLRSTLSRSRDMGWRSLERETWQQWDRRPARLFPPRGRGAGLVGRGHQVT